MSTPDDARLAELLAGLTPSDSELVDPPADLWDGIAAGVSEESSVDAPPVVLSTRRDRPDNAPMSVRLPWLAAVAAVLVLAAVGGVLVAVLRDEPTTAPTTQVIARAELGQLEPLGTTAATARLVEEGGQQRLVIDATDMPAAPEGSDYELWLIDPGVTDPRSLGTVTGSGDVVIPPSIDPADHPIVDISLEPRDGDAHHSGHSLMRGTLR